MCSCKNKIKNYLNKHHLKALSDIKKRVNNEPIYMKLQFIQNKIEKKSN